MYLLYLYRYGYKIPPLGPVSFRFGFPGLRSWSEFKFF